MPRPHLLNDPLKGGFAHRNLPLLMLQARERVLAQFRPTLNAAGVTEQQWRVIRALLETGPLEQREVGALCGLSSPSLAVMLARMEELGLVERQRLDHDQRRVRVSVTPRARAIAARMAPKIEAAYADIERRLGKSFLLELHRQLDRLIIELADPQDDTAASDG